MQFTKKCTTQTRLWADSEWMNDETNNLLQSILQYEYIVFTLHFLCCALNIRAASTRSHELQRIIMTKAIENTHTDDDIFCCIDFVISSVCSFIVYLLGNGYAIIMHSGFVNLCSFVYFTPNEANTMQSMNNNAIGYSHDNDHDLAFYKYLHLFMLPFFVTNDFFSNCSIWFILFGAFVCFDQRMHI